MKKLFLSILIAVLVLPALATHNMAGDISYSQISGYTYRITIRTITNTVGTSADRCEIWLYYGDGDSVFVPRSNGPAGLCSPGLMGIAFLSCSGAAKINEYTAIHTYAVSGSYTLRVEDPNRSAGIMNISNSLNTPFHLEAELNINPFFSGNSSPAMTNFPVVCSAAYGSYSYNPGAVDPDGDSLYYENFLRGTFNYSDPAASNQFYIDSLTGNVEWDLPTTIGSYVYDIKVTQWKNVGGSYYYAGYTTQEVWTSITAATGIDNPEQKTDVTIYPNPASGNINFQLNGLNESNCFINISNAFGQTIRRIDISMGNKDLLTVEGLPSGMYFYELLNSEKNLSKGKFLIIQGF